MTPSGAQFAAYRLPLDPAVATAAGRFEARRGWWVGVQVAGCQGLGEAAPWPGFGAGFEAVSGWLVRPEHSPPPEVRAALSLARADAQARLAGVSLAQFWGAEVFEVRGHVGVADAEAALRCGARTLKIKVAAAPLAEDVARIVAIRAARPEADLRLDANGGWDLTTTLAALAALAPQRIKSIEQPLAVDAPLSAWVEVHAAARWLGVAIFADESVGDLARFEALLAARALDGVVLKPAVLGGFVATRALALRAVAAGLEVCVTHTCDSPIGRLGALHAALALAAEVPNLSVGLDGGPDGPGNAVLEGCRRGPGVWGIPPGAGLGLDEETRQTMQARFAGSALHLPVLEGEFCAGVRT
jgi:L-alanine-DL-glutamate epimerase-like enolase superfamily enzyme